MTVRAHLRTAHHRLLELRADPRRRAIVGAVGALLGLALATIHWLGFLLAGVLVGAVARSVREAVGAAAVVGIAAVVVFATYAWWHGQLSAVLGLGELTLLAVVIALGLTVLGSLVRGLG